MTSGPTPPSHRPVNLDLDSPSFAGATLGERQVRAVLAVQLQEHVDGALAGALIAWTAWTDNTAAVVGLNRIALISSTS